MASRPGSAFPNTPWTLNAPESYVLLHGPQAKGAEVFKMAVMELVARGVIKLRQVEQPARRGRGKSVTVMAPGAGKPPTEASLAPVWDAFNATPLAPQPDGEIGVPVSAFARSANTHFKSFGQYTSGAVLPALIERGLYAQESYKVLWLFPATRLTLTPEGQRMRDDLQTRSELAKQRLGGWVNQDTARAAAFLSLAGASFLLMPHAYGDLGRLNERLREQSRNGAGVETGVLTTTIERDQDGERFGGDFDLGNVSFDFDLSAFDSLGDAFSAIDSGVDSGSGSDGGDGGGGGGSD